MAERNQRNNVNRRVVSKKKVRRYRILRFLDPGVIIFMVLALYLCGCMIIYMLKPHITTYEVNEGTMATDYSYTGIAIRNEQLVNVEQAGFITYYARDLEKTGAKTKVYSIDETGQLDSILSDESISATSLNDEQRQQLNNKVDEFYKDYTNNNFTSAYNFKQSIEAATIQLIEQTLIENAALLENNTSFHVCNSQIDGVLSYTVDGYENLKEEDVTADMLSEGAKKYSPIDLRDQELVKSGDIAYKIITDDTWSVIIKTDKDVAKKLLDKEYVKVEFKKDKTSANGKVAIWDKGEDTFVSLSFTNSMIRFAQDRFVDISFELDNISGIKVPKSSIAEKELFVIDNSFVVTGDSVEGDCVYSEAYDENGNAVSKKVPIDIAYETDTYVYINEDEDGVLVAGTTLKAKGDTNEHMTIGKTEKLKGVYQYNKGYPVFCPINILYEGKEYCIISSQSKYGLSKYDYIVLNSEAIDGAVATYK